MYEGNLAILTAWEDTLCLTSVENFHSVFRVITKFPTFQLLGTFFLTSSSPSLKCEIFLILQVPKIMFDKVWHAGEEITFSLLLREISFKIWHQFLSLSLSLSLSHSVTHTQIHTHKFVYFIFIQYVKCHITNATMHCLSKNNYIHYKHILDVTHFTGNYSLLALCDVSRVFLSVRVCVCALVCMHVCVCIIIGLPYAQRLSGSHWFDSPEY